MQRKRLRGMKIKTLIEKRRNKKQTWSNKKR